MAQTDYTFISTIIEDAISWYDKEPERYEKARMEVGF